MSISVRDILSRHVAATKRRWGSDRQKTVGASDVGQCARKTWFVKHEGDPTAGIDRDEDYEDRWGAVVRGSIFENAFWGPAMVAQLPPPARLLYAGREQKTLASGHLSATPDGLVVDAPADALSHLGVSNIESDCFVIECKTADPRTRLDHPKLEHVFQTHVQMGLLRERTNHQPTYALISYADASWWDDVKEFAIKFDPMIYAEAKRRAGEIMEATSAFQLKPEGVIAGGKECRYCPFSRTCRGVEAKEAAGGNGHIGDPEALAVLVPLARAFRAAKTETEAAETRERDLAEQIKQALTQHGIRKAAGNGVAVNWSAVAGRSSWDWKGIRTAAEDAGIDLSPFEKTGEPSDRLVVTVENESENR